MKNNKQFPLVLFFILAFAFPWIIWGTSIAQTRGLLNFHIPQSLAFWIGLNLATYITAGITDGWKAIKDIILRLIRWRVNPIWYIVAFLFTSIVGFVSIGINYLLGGTHQIGVLLSTSKIIPSLLFQIFFFWLTEETAWRGFALPRLQAKYNSLTASIILGVLWGIWHLPLVFIPGSFQSTVPFIGFVLSAIATSIMITWIFNNSRGSVLIAALFHGSTDVAIAYLNVMTGSLRLFWIFIIIQYVFVLAILLIYKPKYLSHHKKMDEVVYSPIVLEKLNE